MSAAPIKYPLAPAFEAGVALLCATSQSFYGRCGHALDPPCLTSPAAALVVRACHAVHADTGRGPGDLALAQQRLARLHHEGAVTAQELADVDALLFDAPALDAEAAISELAPVLRRRAEAALFQEGLDLYARKASLAGMAEKLARVAQLGAVETTAGSRLGLGSFADIDAMRTLDRLPTPVPELDLYLDGGLPRGTFGIYMAPTGEGKSVYLCHQATVAWLRGLFVVYATLELPRGVIDSRIISAATGVPINGVVGPLRAEAERRLAALLPRAGILLVQDLTPEETTGADLTAWVQTCERQEGRPVDVVCVDYMDKVGSHLRVDRDNRWQGQASTAEYLRVWTKNEGKFLWSAVQVKGRDAKERGKARGTDDAAGSKERMWKANLVVTRTADPQQPDRFTLKVAKFTLGRSGDSLGPFVHDHGCGRVVMQPEEPTPHAAVLDRDAAAQAAHERDLRDGELDF